MTDNFTITDVNGTPQFELKGSHVSLHSKKILTNAAGQPVAVLAKKLASLHGSWEIYAGASTDGTPAATIKPSKLGIKKSAHVIVTQFGDQPFFEVKGDFRAKSFNVTRGGQVVAEVARAGKFSNATKFLTGNDSYTLTVQPGVDYAFMVALVIVLDTVYNPDPKSGGAMGIGF